MDEEKIRNEAKQIMDDFMKELDKIDAINEEFGNKRDVSMRIPKECKYGEEFKQKMLDNAPKKEDNCILAEKKKW